MTDHSSVVCNLVSVGNGLVSLSLPLERAEDLIVRMAMAILTAVLSNLVYRVVDQYLKRRKDRK